MPFGRDTRVVPSNTVLDRGPGLVAVLLSGSIVGHINEVTVHRAGLVLRWVTKPPGSLSLAIPPRVGYGNEYWRWLRPPLRKKW